MQARAHDTRPLKAFFEAIAEPIVVWVWTKWVARKSIATGPTSWTRSMIASLAPMPAAAQGWRVSLSAPGSSPPEVPALAPEATGLAEYPTVTLASELVPIVIEEDVPPTEAVEPVIAAETILETPVVEVAAVIVEDAPAEPEGAELFVDTAPEPSAEIDVSQAMELAEAILAAEAVDQAPPDDDVDVEIIATEPEPAEKNDADSGDIIEPSRPTDFGLAARMAIIGTMNAPTARASKRARQIAPAGRAVPVQKPATLKVRKSDKPSASHASGRARKVRTSAEVIDLASIRDVANAKNARRAA